MTSVSPCPKVPEEKAALLGYSPYHGIQRGIDEATAGGMSAEDAAAGRGLHSSTSQLNLSRIRHKIHPKHPLILLNTP